MFSEFRFIIVSSQKKAELYFEQCNDKLQVDYIYFKNTSDYKKSILKIPQESEITYIYLIDYHILANESFDKQFVEGGNNFVFIDDLDKSQVNANELKTSKNFWGQFSLDIPINHYLDLCHKIRLFSILDESTMFEILKTQTTQMGKIVDLHQNLIKVKSIKFKNFSLNYRFFSGGDGGSEIFDLFPDSLGNLSFIFFRTSSYLLMSEIYLTIAKIREIAAENFYKNFSRVLQELIAKFELTPDRLGLEVVHGVIDGDKERINIRYMGSLQVVSNQKEYKLDHESSGGTLRRPQKLKIELGSGERVAFLSPGCKKYVDSFDKLKQVSRNFLDVSGTDYIREVRYELTRQSSDSEKKYDMTVLTIEKNDE
jgi:hypothetical protein